MTQAATVKVNIFFKGLQALLMGVLIFVATECLVYLKRLDKWVTVTTEVDRRQDESISNNTIMISKRQEADVEQNNKFVFLFTKLGFTYSP